MNEQFSTILNTDWKRRQWMHYVYSRSMEDISLLDSCKKGSILQHDAHHEKIMLPIEQPCFDPLSANIFQPSPSTSVLVPKRFIKWYNSMTFDNGYKQLYSFDELA
ncbi:uncharacterized protein BX664DRAFT_318238 [Halteromyces radiatus]|uniref:uncharacterized protein n=1 Tax=Halteromyces radiatus TaxID=101107 RepID=UPI00221E45F2|nr:uncharacterized protein BX664DRAFT_318238 [Halteromyces radiatus]KAI8078901.1 hypothetical protein BX664DRAFT_318238 [Halteromyces radiatus]